MNRRDFLRGTSAAAIQVATIGLIGPPVKARPLGPVGVTAYWLNETPATAMLPQEVLDGGFLVPPPLVRPLWDLIDAVPIEG